MVFNSLDFLHHLSPEISDPKGHLAASIKAKGTLGNARIETQLTLDKASLSIAKLGLNLDKIHFNMIGKENRWDASGSISAANSSLSL